MMKREQQGRNRLASMLTPATVRPKIAGNDGFLQAAVLIPLIEKNKEWSLLFEVRSPQLFTHAGEICFPGGGIEEQDRDISGTAVRETGEELGIAPEFIQVAGALDMLVSPIGVILYPVVGFVSSRATIRHNREVAEYFTVPLSFLSAAKPEQGIMEMATRPLGGAPAAAFPGGYSAGWKIRRTFPVWAYHYKRRMIWGLTAQVLHRFLELCRKMDIK